MIGNKYKLKTIPKYHYKEEALNHGSIITKK